MFGIKNRQFQGIDNTANRIDYPSSQKPMEGLRRQGIDNLRKSEHTYPAHGDI